MSEYDSEAKLGKIRTKAVQLAEKNIVSYNAVNLTREKNDLTRHKDLDDRIARLKEIVNKIRTNKKLPLSAWMPTLIVLLSPSILLSVIGVKSAINSDGFSAGDLVPSGKAIGGTVIVSLFVFMLLRTRVNEISSKILIKYYNKGINKEEAAKELSSNYKGLIVNSRKLLTKIKQDVKRGDDGTYHTEL